jgi:signal transduction histidine kinase
MADTPVELKKLTLQTSLARMDSGDFCVQIEIQDKGHGIAIDDENKIFSPFFTTKNEGMGIGLSLVKSLTERHGGRIFWKTNPDRGVTFILQFPQYTKSF